MNPTNKKEKLFILSMVLWGLWYGLFILAIEMGYKGHNLIHNNPLFVLASSVCYIIAGMCTIGFTYFRGKALMVAVVVTSALSIIFDFTQLIALFDSHHGKKTPGKEIGEGSVHVQEGTIETVICLGIIFKVLFLFVFKEKCRTSTPAFVHLKEDTDSLPPPPPAYDNLEKKSNEAITPLHLSTQSTIGLVTRQISTWPGKESAKMTKRQGTAMY